MPTESNGPLRRPKTSLTIAPVTTWNRLDAPWRHAMRAAIEAYLDDSAPIGAVVFDSNDRAISIGRNDFERDRLAHAELQALKGVPANANREALSLYSTMEPCPMCTGAIRMMQLRSLHFAAKDPAAGSTELLSATAFMKRFACDVVGPSDAGLEFANVALMLEHRTRNGHRRWRDEWSSYLPEAVAVGEKLAADRRFTHWQRHAIAVDAIFDEVCSHIE